MSRTCLVVQSLIISQKVATSVVWNYCRYIQAEQTMVIYNKCKKPIISIGANNVFHHLKHTSLYEDCLKARKDITQAVTIGLAPIRLYACYEARPAIHPEKETLFTRQHRHVWSLDVICRLLFTDHRFMVKSATETFLAACHRRCQHLVQVIPHLKATYSLLIVTLMHKWFLIFSI